MNFSYNHKHLDRAYRKLAQKHGIDHTVKMTEILVLMLRLRQICCHSGLIKTALGDLPDIDHLEGDGGMDESDGGIMERLEALNIAGEEGDVSFSEVQNLNVRSTKLVKVMEVLNRVLLETRYAKIVFKDPLTFG